MKTVLITGASRGIGAAIAKTFAFNGYNVIINYNKSEKQAARLQKELSLKNCRVSIKKADVSDEQQVRQMISEINAESGGVDILINNAGIALYKLLIDTSLHEWNDIFNVNMTGMFLCTREVLQNMIANKSGKIINISSIWGTVGASMEVAYSASKGAVIAFTKALAKEMGLTNINVNCICPGVTDTDMIADCTKVEIDELKQITPLNKIGSPDDIANAALFLASDKSNFITGQVLTVDGGISI